MHAARDTTTAPENGLVKATFTRAGVWTGMRASALVSLPVVPFGMAFGLAASEAGIGLEFGVLMSLIVFAGLSQLAIVELWATPMPVMPILLITLSLNTRHLLYGAALSSWASGVRPWQRYLAAGVMTDINWALTMQEKERGLTDVGFLFGSGLVLWVVWQLSTVAGYFAGGAVVDPKQFGLDAVVLSVFATTLVGLWRGREDAAPWITAAVASLIAFELLPAGWHIIVGALTGGIVGVLRFAR